MAMPKTLQEAKAAARALRAEAAEKGTPISHAQALERVAHAAGCRDWNTFHARLAGAPAWQVGERVAGSYLGQPFTGQVREAVTRADGWTRLVLDLDTAVDVVRFASFSNLRKRVTGVVGPEGTSEEATSDGVPHLVVTRPPDPPVPSET